MLCIPTIGKSRYCLGRTVGSSVSEDDEVEPTYELAPRISSVLPTILMNICRFNGQSRAACIMPANTCLSGDNAPTIYPAAVAACNPGGKQYCILPQGRHGIANPGNAMLAASLPQTATDHAPLSPLCSASFIFSNLPYNFASNETCHSLHLPLSRPGSIHTTHSYSYSYSYSSSYSEYIFPTPAETNTTHNHLSQLAMPSKLPPTHTEQPSSHRFIFAPAAGTSERICERRKM